MAEINGNEISFGIVGQVESVIYKTEEKPIGQWVDGRTIYRMIIDNTANPAHREYFTFTQEEMPFLQEEFKPDFFIKMDALGVDDQYNNAHRAYLYSTTSGMGERSLYYEKETHRLYTTGSFPIWYIIIEYVKENDEI